MGIELVDACACLEAKDVYTVVLTGQSEAILPRQLAHCANAALTDEEALLGGENVGGEVSFVHFDEAILCDDYNLGLRRLLPLQD